MTEGLDRRGALCALGWGSVAVGAGGLINTMVPTWAQAAGARSRGPRVSYVRAPLSQGIVIHAGGTSLDLYHAHPHNKSEEVLQPEDIRLQTRLVMLNHKEILDWMGLTWRNVVKINRYQKVMSESQDIEDVMADYLKDWWPAMTAFEVTRLSSPQARLEIDLWVIPTAATPG